MADRSHEAAGTGPGSSANGRAAKSLTAVLITVLAIGFSLYEIWSNSLVSLVSIKQSAVFLAFLLALVFLKYPLFPSRGVRWYDYLFAAAGVAVGVYTLFATDRLALTLLRGTTMDYFMGGVALVLVIEAARRSVGHWMAILPVVAILYALFGQYIPGQFGHYGFTLNRFLLRMYLVDEGIYGLTTQVAATYIYLFVLFGSFLAQSGAGQLFTDLSVRLAGRSPGGPAKVATISSALMGSISGSAAANVATTGAFTIPLMKKTGFDPAFAGAVEAVASTGGMIMPPVMGAAAFIMAQYLGMSYGQIMIAALIPAGLYYVSVYAWVHYYALKNGLRGVSREDMPVMTDMARRLILFAPLVIIIWALLSGRTAIYAAFLGIVAVIVSSWLQRDRMGWRDILAALEDGAMSALSACMAAVAAGIIVGVAGMTGIGQVLSLNIMSLSFNNVYIALALTAVASLVMSMGLPATACYVIGATILAPALVRMGVSPIGAHMFVFYFASLSNITPPVAIASYTAAGIAQANPFKLAWQAVRIALPGFIVPFLFAMNPVLLARASNPWILIWSAFTATVGTVMLAAAGAGYLLRPTPLWIRLVYVVASLLLIHPAVETDIAAFVLLAVSLTADFIGTRAERQAALAGAPPAGRGGRTP